MDRNNSPELLNLLFPEIIHESEPTNANKTPNLFYLIGGRRWRRGDAGGGGGRRLAGVYPRRMLHVALGVVAYCFCHRLFMLFDGLYLLQPHGARGKYGNEISRFVLSFGVFVTLLLLIIGFKMAH